MSLARPVPPVDRIERIDVLRGFALLGILPVNLAMMKAPASIRWSGATRFHGPLDDWARGAIAMLFEAKFYPLFALLFGVGLVLQGERLAARGERPRDRLARRLAALAWIGGAHAAGLWFGDILLTYALLGFAALALYGVRSSILQVLAWFGIVGTPLLLAGAVAAALAAGTLFPEWRTEMDARAVEARAELVEDVEDARTAYGHGTIPEIFARNAEDLAAVYAYAWVWGPSVLGWILLGIVVGRSGLLSDPAPHRAALSRALSWLLPLGVLCGAAYAVANFLVPGPGPNGPYVVFQLASAIGGPALALSYGLVVLLAYDHPRWHRRLTHLAPFGRMALTNYLVQSMVGVTVMYAPGLGWYDRVTPAAGLVLAFAIVALQIPLSGWWLRRFRFGPVEWLWRALTYGTLPPMRRELSA